MKLTITNFEKCEDKTLTELPATVPNYRGPMHLVVHSKLKSGSLVGHNTTISIQAETPQEALRLGLHYLHRYERLLLDPEAVAKGAADEVERAEKAAYDAEIDAMMAADEARYASYRALSLDEVLDAFDSAEIRTRGDERAYDADSLDVNTLLDIVGEKYRGLLEAETPIPVPTLARIKAARIASRQPGHEHRINMGHGYPNIVRIKMAANA